MLSLKGTTIQEALGRDGASSEIDQFTIWLVTQILILPENEYMLIIGQDVTNFCYHVYV